MSLLSALNKNELHKINVNICFMNNFLYIIQLHIGFRRLFIFRPQQNPRKIGSENIFSLKQYAKLTTDCYFSKFFSFYFNKSVYF